MVITKDRSLNFTDVQSQLTEKQTRLQSLLAKYPQYATAETAKGLTGLTPATTPTPEPETPMVKFNRALLDMMDKAQRGISSVTATQEGVEKTAAEAYRQPYEGQETLTPAQRLGLMETAGQEYQPTIKGLSANIKNFESVLDIVKKTYGDDFQSMLNITPSKETLVDYQRAFRNGENLSTLLTGLDTKTRQAVFGSLKDEDFEANRLAKVKAGGTTTEIKAENYDQAKQRAIELFEEDRMRNADKKVSPALYKEMRLEVPDSLRDNFDKWAVDRNYLSEETIRKYTTLGKVEEEPVEEKPASVAKNKVGFVVDSMITGNEKAEEITNYIRAEGYDPNDSYFSKKIEGYQPKKKTGWLKTQGKKVTDFWGELKR